MNATAGTTSNAGGPSRGANSLSRLTAGCLKLPHRRRDQRLAHIAIWLFTNHKKGVASTTLASDLNHSKKRAVRSPPPSYQLASVVIGIPVSFIPVYIMSQFGTIYAVAAFGALGGVIGLLALIGLPETFRNQSTES